MTDSKQPEDDAAEGGEDRAGKVDDDDAPVRASGDVEDDEEDPDEKIDLDDLDRLGVDGVVDEMGGGAERAPARKRPAWLAGLTMIAAILLLSWMWDDFRFWLQPSSPIQIGAASDWVRDGEVPPNWTNTYVGIDGTPNVRWAMVTSGKNGAQDSVFDLIEAQGQLFVVTPQVSDEHQTRRYAGHFEGRLRRLGDDALVMGHMPKLYADEGVTRTVDLTVQSLVDARRDDSLEFVTEHDGTLELAPEDRVRFVVDGGDARIMMGGLSFRTGEDAEAAVAALGHPYFRLPDLVAPADPRKALGGARSAEPPRPGRPDAFRFIVRIPVAERPAAHKALEAKMIAAADPTDHRKGVSIFARPSTYFAPAGAVTIAGEQVVFPHDENDPAPGYVEKDGKLVEQMLPDGLMHVDLDALTEVRLELPIVVDPDGYILVAGQTPADYWAWGVAFLGVLVIAALNGMWLVLGVLRRRR